MNYLIIQIIPIYFLFNLISSNKKSQNYKPNIQFKTKNRKLKNNIKLIELKWVYLFFLFLLYPSFHNQEQKLIVSILELLENKRLHTESMQIPERLLEQKPLVSKLYSLSKTMKYQRNVVSRIGFEPMTPSLKGKCSTN